MLLSVAVLSGVFIAAPVQSAEYKIDTQGAHAFIQFKVSHLGYSFVMGRFNEFSGEFNFDAQNINDAKVSVTINTQSVDSNHAERDKHLRGKDFLNTAAFPKATFVSTSVVEQGDKKFTINGDLTFNGVTKPISIDALAIGAGKDPWGGYRAGFSGTTRFKMKDYNMRMDLGPASAYVDLTLVVEGIKQ
ncbi:YceI family protein [Shewanella intestini]|uniref:YceI family protein n=1 Tax=Shewanella intestini TaxID=2017544 RepID=A0ABS5I2I1_9GAMM|nr:MULTISPECIES: YceI family protein [Shewanella]MBR9728237.1 YceI family protein [Shewanella intestini]MRG35702.1 YceI family protein [Shewanella sp. XMDDZSB0408]